MSKQFSGYDISSFIDSGVNYYMNDIEGRVIDMVHEEDKEERNKIKDEIQAPMCNLAEFIR